MEQAKPVVEIRDLSVKYPNGVMALEGINIDVNERDLIALIGPNGAGKSTLLKVVLGLKNQRAAQSNSSDAQT